MALAVAEADEEVMVSDDRVVETGALELAPVVVAPVVAAPLPWKVN